MTLLGLLKHKFGIDGYGMPIVLDIHEKAHGPHGLIAGSTGSGKSEFIITYILSLAINYHPDDVSFILIDYKGGALSGAFKKRNIKLPHLVGTITNIDTAELQRSLASIQSELRRRQIVFNEVRNMTDEGTIDIYKYQKLYHEGRVKEPIPHLLIICDEFAELKQQQEEFMNELISVARIGRSLGVHLILATQKPAGIVDEQIRGNSKFGICLKVQDAQDSLDVIKRPDAARLKGVGQFYMQVGNDDYFVLGQSAWSGAPYIPTNLTEKKVDTAVDFISNTGSIIKRIDDAKQKKIKDKGEQLTNIVTYLHKLANENNIQSKQLWLDNIPENIYIKDIIKKYNVKKEGKTIAPIIGEYDDPGNQRQGPVKLDIMKSGNTIIYGNAQSGKENLLSTIVYSTISSYSSEEVSLYLLDFGTETLGIYKQAPHVGDVVFINDTEKIERFLKMIEQEIEDRKKIISEYNGDFYYYLQNNSMNKIVVLINNYEIFSENYENYDDLFSTITREGIKYGIVFIITASSYNDVRYRLAQNFKNKIALQLNNEDDYYNIFDNVGKKRPSHIFGRGLVKIDNQLYEFQTAKICEAEKWNVFIREEIEKIRDKNDFIARRIPVMPNRITKKDVESAYHDIQTVPLGIQKEDLSIYTYDFKKNFVSILTSRNIEYAISYINHVVEEIGQLKEIQIHILDAEKVIKTKKDDLQKSYNSFILELEENYNNATANKKMIICVIIGVDKFINELENGEADLLEIFNKAKEAENYSFIITDNATRIKNHEYDGWYKEYVRNENGIWIGNGIDEQYVININASRTRLINYCGNDYGYVVSDGEPQIIKLLGMQEKGE